MREHQDGTGGADGDSMRLAKRVAELQGCSRREAEWLVEGGSVQVDGQVSELPGARVRPDQAIVVAAGARAQEIPPVTLLLHKPAGWEAGLGQGPAGDPRHARGSGAPDAVALLEPAARYAGDSPPVRVLQRHFRQLECFTPLASAASGLVVFTQDRRMARRLEEDIETLEQECVVTVEGRIAEGGLARLCQGLEFNGRPLPPAKVSWQSETRLRFAAKGIRPGQIPAMCEAVGLRVTALKRLRIGRVALAKLPEGQWRYLLPWERF
ncbi:rRNA pseudouridine synthase [Paracidovorax konjaci]|uniref:Dual-specificity RNA pseudouridine synthase RluF n=1 Tax=Paracidovorax konjaci TaxID=32040 RepID=A0A1I1VVS3_9BURK|nr:rRNA pseudouridine synthase [Paracidovorax konjaci]SFD86188.1 23S rRNA pseudouridine2604 synthase [Paracidovorax konjaci]